MCHLVTYGPKWPDYLQKTSLVQVWYYRFNLFANWTSFVKYSDIEPVDKNTSVLSLSDI